MKVSEVIQTLVDSTGNGNLELVLHTSEGPATVTMLIKELKLIKTKSDKPILIGFVK